MSPGRSGRPRDMHLAHIAGLPLEELVVLALAGGGMALAAICRAALALVPRPRHDRHMVRNALWVAALGIIAAYLFFLALGAFSFTDSMVLSVLVIVLALLWIGRGIVNTRRVQELRDPRLVHARERRGF